jgi:hypothetical protein
MPRDWATSLALFCLRSSIPGRTVLDVGPLCRLWRLLQLPRAGEEMIPFRCDWCDAAATTDDRMVSLARHRVVRRPRKWDIEDETFSTFGSEAMFHEKCFVDNAREILDGLYSGIQVAQPRKRPADLTR